MKYLKAFLEIKKDKILVTSNFPFLKFSTRFSKGVFPPFSGVFSPLTSAETCEKSSRGFGKKSYVSTDVRKPGNTYALPTAMI